MLHREGRKPYMTYGQSSRALYGPLGSSVYVPPGVNLGKDKGARCPGCRVDTPSAFLATYRTLHVMRLLKGGVAASRDTAWNSASQAR
ncbi:hypothetical protein GCM10010207_39070 [Streptomyces atratus]|nr:hypothetical protein GCM10010207_39070 [Streptomyces atratus]